MSPLPEHLSIYIPGLMELQLAGTLLIFADAQKRARVNEVQTGIRGTWIMIALVLSGAAIATGLVVADVYRYTPGSIPLLAAGLAAPVVLGTQALLFKPVHAMVQNLNPAWLVSLQFLRSFGLIFPILADLGHLPRLFASAAGYGDIAVGVLAPTAAYLWCTSPRFGRKAVIAWNIFGIFDIFGLAITTYLIGLPGLISAAEVSPSSAPMNAFPLALIPGFIAPFFVLLHIYIADRCTGTDVACGKNGHRKRIRSNRSQHGVNSGQLCD